MGRALSQHAERPLVFGLASLEDSQRLGPGKNEKSSSRWYTGHGSVRGTRTAPQSTKARASLFSLAHAHRATRTRIRFPDLLHARNDKQIVLRNSFLPPLNMAKENKSAAPAPNSGSLTSRALKVVLVAFLLNIISSVISPKIWQIISPSGGTLSSNNATVVPVKLYGSSMSTCTRRVATILKEKNVPYELVPIDFAKMEHKSPDYVATKQPFGQVPVLQVSFSAYAPKI